MIRAYTRISGMPVMILLVATLVCSVIFSTFERANAYGECDAYGFMATYDILTDSCKCMSGYVFKNNFLGEPQCVSGNTVCHDKYGYNSRYDSLSKSCECDYGYEFGSDSIGRTQCVSRDQMCRDQLGYSSSYDSLSGRCKCSYGYVIDGGQCRDGDSVCRSEHGIYSGYDSLANQCECDSGYTLDDSSQCVKKQNNAYFKLLDVNTDERLAIIKSNYDGSQYFISYGTGCYSGSMNRNVNDLIVVNLGTDFYVDRYDKLVLPDDNEVCDIRSVERTFDDSFEEMFPTEEETDEVTYYVPAARPALPAPVKAVQTQSVTVLEEVRGGSASGVGPPIAVEDGASKSESVLAVTSNAVATQTPPAETKEGLAKRIWHKVKDFFDWN